MDRAKLRNQHMMEQYKAYLRETRSSNHLPPDAGLSMLRRLEENVRVAKIQEQAVSIVCVISCWVLWLLNIRYWLASVGEIVVVNKN